MLKGQKAQLVRAAWRKGPGVFSTQLARSLRDTLWSKRQLVYTFDLARLGVGVSSAMTSLLAKRKKVILLVSALRRGPVEFLKQLYFSVADLARRKHLVFRIDLDDKPLEKGPVAVDATIRKIGSWQEVPPDLQQRLERGSENIEWGSKRFFEAGRELWVLEIGGKIAVLGWLSSPEVEEHYVWPVPSGAEIFHQLTVLPEFRGQGLQVLHRRMLMQARADSGVRQFYVSCHEYNSTSHRNILRMGMKQVGYATRSWRTGELTFHPNIKGAQAS